MRWWCGEVVYCSQGTGPGNEGHKSRNEEINGNEEMGNET